MDLCDIVRDEAASKQISICDFCIANVWGPDGWAKIGITEAKLSDPNRGGFHHTYKTIFQNVVESAGNGCWWCGNIANAILREEELLGNGGETTSAIMIVLSFPIPRGRKPRRLGLLIVSIRCDHLDSNVPLELSFGMFSKLNGLDQRYFVTQSSQNLAKSSFHSSLAREWLDDCIQNHNCSQYGANCPPPLPHRVLNVKNELQIQLQCPQDSARSNYVCLSYAWGGPQPLILTASSQDSLKTGISIHEFPPTIRDAIHTVRELGLEYLWVDALCILQDSDEDKTAELERMHQYYHYATLCIQPTGVRSVNDHFLSPKLIVEPKTDLNDAPDHVNLNSTSTMIFHSDDGLEIPLSIELEPMIYQEEWEPLHQRAWVLQERLLSHRLLIFPQAGGLVWQCEQLETHDGVVYSHYPDRARYRLPAADMKDTEKVIGQWNKMVMDYSDRELTCLDDRFIAIAALAELFSNRWGQELGLYCAGHWSKVLPQSLLWRGVLRLSRPSYSAVAPTWSWASCNGQVDWRYDMGTAYKCEVLDCKIELSNPEHQFGAVKSGILRLKCLVTAARLQRSSRFSDGCSNLHSIDGSQTVIGLANLDGRNLGFEKLEPKEVTLVHFTSDKGIVVTELVAGTYIRIGFFYRDPDYSDFESIETVITLV